MPGIVLGDEDKTIMIAIFSALMELQASGKKMKLSNSNDTRAENEKIQDNLAFSNLCGSSSV